MLKNTEAGASVGIVLALMTAIGWGIGWPATKIAMADLPPLVARGAAGMAAASGLLFWAAANRQKILPNARRVPPLIFLSLTNVVAWMGLSAVSLIWLRVSEAALLTFTMPIWAMLLAWPIRGERPRPASLLALMLGIGGLILLLSPAGGNLQGKLPGILAAIGAAVIFAFGSVLSRQHEGFLNGVDLSARNLASIGWLIGLGSVIMLAIGLFFAPPILEPLHFSGKLALGYMAVGPMCLCYVAWFCAISRISSTKAAIVLLLVPVIGTISAVFILGEPLSVREAIALLLTMSGVAIEVSFKTKGQSNLH
ncbi:MAG: DMT family transporter [Rhizobiaceae bacterium]|nr:DMT family transporter [Rhizobiaceae bacterium]